MEMPDRSVLNVLITTSICLPIFLPINRGYEVSTVLDFLAVDSFLRQFRHRGEWFPRGLCHGSADSQCSQYHRSLCLAFETGFIRDVLGRKDHNRWLFLLCWWYSSPEI